MADPTETEEAQLTTLADCPDQRRFLEDLRSFLGEDLARVEERIQGAVGSSFEFNHLARQAAAMGGKRLRPMLVLLSASATQGRLSHIERDELISIAASVELVHAASLVHDDVLDQAALRRHRPTILSQADNKTAVLLGDFLFTRAYALAATCRSTLPARQIAAAASSLCTGELRQGSAAGNWTLPLSQYRQMLVQKTGSLCGTSCRLGAWRAGGPQADQRSLKRFGVLLGLAFQVFDDWLDYWGSEAVGKTLGTDLKQGKTTLPILRYLATQPQDRQAMLRLLDSDDETRFEQVRGRLDQTDAAQYTLRAAQQSAEQARASVCHLSGETARDFLQGLANFSANRKA